MTHRIPHWRQPSGDTGHTLELDYLYPPNDPRRRVIDTIDQAQIEYKSLAQSLLGCLKPSENPGCYKGKELWDPPAGWMRDVHYAIVESLGLEDWSQLKIVPTLKTAADKYHGIDFLVIYTEPETDRDVIVSVDLSLRHKEGFKADVLVTDTGAMPNQEFFFAQERETPDVMHASAQEEKYIRQEQRRNAGVVIADIIAEKLKREEDPHYARALMSLRRGRNEVHERVVRLLETSSSAN